MRGFVPLLDVARGEGEACRRAEHDHVDEIPGREGGRDVFIFLILNYIWTHSKALFYFLLMKLSTNFFVIIATWLTLTLIVSVNSFNVV